MSIYDESRRGTIWEEKGRGPMAGGTKEGGQIQEKYMIHLYTIHLYENILMKSIILHHEYMLIIQNQSLSKIVINDT